jgi:hypothetical protein
MDDNGQGAQSYVCSYIRGEQMDWSLLIPTVAAGLVGLGVGFTTGLKAERSALLPVLQSLSRANAEDRMAYLGILRRELANMLVKNKANLFLELYKETYKELDSFKLLRPELLSAKRDELCKKYFLYTDFDLFGTKDHVLYSDACCSYEEMAAYYKDIICFQQLNIILDKDWAHFKAISENDLKHLEKYVGRVNDTLLKKQLKQAMKEYHTFHTHSPDKPFNTPNFRVDPIGHFAEVRYGIHVKATNEFGIFGIFFADNEKNYESFFRSDPSFKTEERLDPLSIEETSLC